MIVKGNKKITDFKFLLMFDLASKLTGVCLWDLSQKLPVYTEQINASKGSPDLVIGELYKQLSELFEKLKNKYGATKENMFVSFEAAPSQIRGGNGSTIQTFVALARAHATLDLYTVLNNYNVYDYSGIYPITTHNYLKKITNMGKTDKVEKSDTKKYVCSEYHLGDISYDEADAVFLAKTLVELKWNNDIQELIREQKRHKKELKAAHAIASVEEQILLLQSLMI